MALGLEDKKAIVAEVQEAADGALSAVVADSRGVTLAAMTALRKARETGMWMKVVRNTLARRAVEGTEYECLTESLVGPIQSRSLKNTHCCSSYLQKLR